MNGSKSQIRVDAEPDSNKIQVQSGGGKNSTLDTRIDIKDITDKQSVSDWVNSNTKLKGLGTGAKKQIINNIWKAYQWLKS